MDHETASTKLAVERYLLGEMTQTERDEFEDHYFDCQDCAEAIQSGTVFMANGKAIAKEERSSFPPRPERVTAMRPRSGARGKTWWSEVAAAAAAVLLTITGYQTLVTIPRLKSPQAVTRSVLRPQSRGSIPVLKERPDIKRVLSLELNTSHPRDRYEVDVVKSGRTLYRIPSAPVQDGLVEVMLPKDIEAGAYEMLLRVPADGSEAGRYVFQLER